MGLRPEAEANAPELTIFIYWIFYFTVQVASRFTWRMMMDDGLTA